MCGNICIIQDITSSRFHLKSPFWGHHTHSIRHRVYCICVITANLSMLSQPLYVWYHIQYICDITSTKFMTYYPLSVTSQHSVLMTQHSAYVWHPLHCRWQRTDSISPNHCIYDVTSTSAMTTQPCIRYHTHCIYVITPSPLTFHPLMYDITPTFWVTSY